MFDTPALDGFADQSRADLAVTAAGGVAALLVGYLGVAVVLTGTPTAPPADGSAGRLATAAGSVACWGYYGLAFTRGRGGPILNAVVYPLVTVGVVPTAWRWLTVGIDPSGLVGGLVSFGFGPIVGAVVAVGPGLGCFVAVLWAWGARLGERERREWERRHLRPAFRQEFLDEE
jgi:hypothetical protein